MVIGEAIRDWSVSEVPCAFFPYDSNFCPVPPEDEGLRILWPYRSNLSNNKLFAGKTKVEGGLRWYEYGRLTSDKLRTPLSIAFAEVVSHNHFVLDRGGKVFNRTAPIIKLKAGATEEEHLALLAYLNSSTACFWMKQVCFNKGSAEGLLAERSKDRIQLMVARGTTGGGGNYEFAGTAISGLPIPKGWNTGQLTTLGREATDLGRSYTEVLPSVHRARVAEDFPQLRSEWVGERERIRARLVAVQEQIDWVVYGLFGLVGAPLVGDKADWQNSSIEPGQRPFEIALARAHSTTGDLPVFGNDGHRYEHQPPARLSSELARIWEARAVIGDRQLSHCEGPGAKRRWRVPAYKDDFDARLADYVLEAVEREVQGCSEVSKRSVLERRATQGHEAVAAAIGFLGSVDFLALLAQDAVPFLAAYRHTESGLEKRTQWE
ncbi:MAG: hypothetical protein WCI05_09730, partial [Myxococcales bacterium]